MNSNMRYGALNNYTSLVQPSTKTHNQKKHRKIYESENVIWALEKSNIDQERVSRRWNNKGKTSNEYTNQGYEIKRAKHITSIRVKEMKHEM